MVNLNVFDTVMSAVEEYNQCIVRKNNTKMTDDERRGLFYTILRRSIPFKIKRKFILKVFDLKCEFYENGELKSFKIPDRYSLFLWDSERYEQISELKKIGDTLKKLYPTKVLNEMSLIVNSINK